MSIISNLIYILRQFEGTVERASSPDVLPESSIDIVDTKVITDYSKLNTPFTLPCKLIKFGVPDSNSMDGSFDYGHNVIYLEPDGKINHKIMVDWIADQFLTSEGMLAADCVYRMMVNDEDNPKDFSKPHKAFIIHRLHKVGLKNGERFFKFKGINNPSEDSHIVKEKNLLWLLATIVY